MIEQMVEFLGGPMDGQKLPVDSLTHPLPPMYRYVHSISNGERAAENISLLMSMSRKEYDDCSSFYLKIPDRNCYRWVGNVGRDH